MTLKPTAHWWTGVCRGGPRDGVRFPLATAYRTVRLPEGEYRRVEFDADKHTVVYGPIEPAAA